MINNFKYYLNFIPSQNKWHLFLIFLGLLIVTFLEMISLAAIPSFVAVIIDTENLANFVPFEKILVVLNSYNKNDLVLIFSILILSFFVLKNIFIFIFIYFENHVYFTLGTFFSEKIFFKYQNQGYEKYIESNPPTLIRNCIDIVNNHVAFIKSVVDLFKDVFLLIFIFGLIIYFSNKEAFIILVFLLIFTLIYYFFIKRKQMKYATEIEKHRLEQITLIESFFGAFKDIKLFNLDKVVSKNFTFTTFQKLKFAMKSLVLNATPRLFIEIIGMIFIFSLIFKITLQSADVKTIFPTLALYIAAVIRLIPIFSSLTKNISTLNYFKVSSNILLEELNDNSNLTNKITQNLVNNITTKTKTKNEYILKTQNLCFKYPKTEKLTLNQINFEIDKNDFVGIFGKSGSGKTTLIDILTGFLNPTSGKIISYNGNDIQQDIQSWQKEISYIGQTSYLLDSSIEENITFNFNHEKIDLKKLEKILKTSELSDFIDSLKNGIKSKIGSKGVKISGGQRQRILIARALFKSSKLIIIDEGTNALDLKTEMKILENLANDKNLTKIIVSHRKESISKCNRVFELNENGLKEIEKNIL